MKPLDPKLRDEIIRALRTAGEHADHLITTHLGLDKTDADWSQSVPSAMSLVPEDVHFICGRSEDSGWFWCDVGMTPQVQHWGDELASAIAGAAFAYLTHPDAKPTGHSPTLH